jgi:hypothetical protein
MMTMKSEASFKETWGSLSPGLSGIKSPIRKNTTPPPIEGHKDLHPS